MGGGGGRPGSALVVWIRIVAWVPLQMLRPDPTQELFNSGPFVVTPFSTWNFQFWHRDPLGGPAGFNFSDGLEVMFCP